MKPRFAYRITSALVAIRAAESNLRISTVHAGTTVTVAGRPKESGLVDVVVDGELVSMFVRDLEDRAELVPSAARA